jgi:ceramide glucosyltransferase
MTSSLWLVCTLFAVIGSTYAVLAGWLASRFGAHVGPPLEKAEDVTVLKPLHGAEAALGANLASFCTQDYPAAIQIVCGVQDPEDPAIAVVQSLRAQFSNREISLAVAPQSPRGNPKISNLLNMFPLSRHGIVILSDSDMCVGPDYIRNVVATLQQPEVGLVTCLYRGRAVGGIWSRLAAAAVDQHFLPSVLVALRFGLAQPCFGSTIALRTEILQRIGGFEAFADALADDYAMGEAVRRLGLRVAIPAFTIGHTFSETKLSEVISHELRWARTIRLVDPKGYAGSILTHPLPFAIAALPLSGFSAISFIILATTLACRLFIPIQVERLPGGGKSSVWLSPLLDLMSFVVFIASFLPGAVKWRGRRYRVGSDGSVTPI